MTAAISLALLLASSCLSSLHARLASSSSSERRLQDEARYLVWDFSERANPVKIPGEHVDELFGSAVSIWDQYMVIGAAGDRHRQFASGATYLYSKQAYSNGDYYWELLEVLEPWDGAEGDNFGCAVDLHMYTLVIGANMHDEAGQDAGAAYIYECYNNAEHHHHEGGQEPMERMWYLAAKLMPEEGLPQDYFGSTVATQGNVTVVGAYGSDVMATLSGAAFVWRKTWNFVDPHHPWEWVYDEMIAPADGQRYDFFSSSLAIYDKKIAIGATGVDDNDMYKVGAVYVYLNSYDDSTEDGFSYQLLKKLTPGDLGVTFENFGQSVSLWDYNLVVGAPNADADGVHAAGAFYSYGFDKYNQPYLIAKVLPTQPSPEGHCGYSIDVFQDLAAMGCPNASGHGSIYIYTEVSPRTTPTAESMHWVVESRKKITDAWSVGDMFGHALSVYNDTVVVGAYKALSDMGATYLYMGRRKVDQKKFDNKTAAAKESTDDEGGVIDEILEELKPPERKMIVGIMFLVTFLAISLYNKKGKESLRESSSAYATTQSYELATMDSTHSGAVDSIDSSASGSRGTSLFDVAASSRHGGPTYSPITTSDTKGSSQRVRDLAAAGLLAKSSQKYTPLPPPQSPPLSFKARSTTPPPEPEQ